MIKNIAYGIGRRKCSSARVFLRKGAGKVTVNGNSLNDYFTKESDVRVVMMALDVTNAQTQYDVLINVKGGGTSGQAGACRHGIARALCMADEANHSSLKANGFLTRDSRMVERKKYGRRGARKRFQFSKR